MVDFCRPSHIFKAHNHIAFVILVYSIFQDSFFGLLNTQHIFPVANRDLQYISIWQYIDTLIEYRIVILCSINIEISKCLIVLSGACLMLLIRFLCV